MCALSGFAQPPEDPEIVHARLELDRVRAMVETGAYPRAQLVKAQEALADATDAVAIRKSMYSPDLTEDQANDLVAAANRRFERRQKALDDAQKLVDVGVKPAQDLIQLRQDVAFAKKECELAATRSEIAAQIAAMAQVEADAQSRTPLQPTGAAPIAERFDGDGVFTPAIFSRIQTAFEAKFGKPLPVSANGETAVHRALGFDHRGRVDVALRPDQPEGAWLRDYLRSRKIPYFAFSQAVPGKATGAHIHLGPPSTHFNPDTASNLPANRQRRTPATTWPEEAMDNRRSESDTSRTR